MSELAKIAEQYGTDKLEHGYISYYENLISRGGISSLLEIGCYKGASVKMWQAYFNKCKISTIDLFMDPRNCSKEEIESAGIKAYKGNQADTEFLNTIHELYDVIIDDGSHNSDHQQITFKHMFMNNLKSGGVYVIEDLHCCKEAFYWGKNITNYDDTILPALLNYEKKGTLANKYFNEEEQKTFSKIIDKVIVGMDKIAFIWRK